MSLRRHPAAVRARVEREPAQPHHIPRAQVAAAVTQLGQIVADAARDADIRNSEEMWTDLCREHPEWRGDDRLYGYLVAEWERVRGREAL